MRTYLPVLKQIYKNLPQAAADLIHIAANLLLDTARRIFTVYVLTDKIVCFTSFSIDI
jgi:hypothetical protein